MLNIGIIDDGVGIFATYYKLRQVVCGNFICKVLDKSFPLSKLPVSELYSVGKQAIDELVNLGCDLIVLSSVTLSAVCYKRLSLNCPVPLYASEAPVLHAATYTVSGVLVCGDGDYALRQSVPNVLCCVMDRFPLLAEQANERKIVDYIDECLQDYVGKFDCVALASSSMNMYKHCFSRVCPNVRIFDSLDGVARKIRKKYKKIAKEDGSCAVVNQAGQDMTEKYGIFLE